MVDFTAAQKILIKDIASDLKPLVDSIENKPAISRDRYDSYLNVLNRMGGDSGETRALMGYCLIEAGANRNGVSSALRILGA